MPSPKYHLHLKGYVGGYDFDSDYVDFILAKNEGKEVNVLIDSLGGQSNTALSIYSAFIRHGCVNAHFVGMNSSAATIGSLRQADVSRSIAPAIYAPLPQPIIIQSSATPQEEINRGNIALHDYTAVIRQLKERLSETFVTINTVAGDNAIKQAKDEYDKLIRNKTPKSRRNILN